MTKKNRTIRYMLAIATVAGIISCKKNNDEATLPSLDGTLKFISLPAYVNPQDEIKFELKGVSNPDGGKIMYCITVTEGYRTLKDTLEDGVMSMTYKICDREHFEQDTLRTISVSAAASAEGYYSSTTGTNQIVIVKGGLTGGSVNGLSASADDIEIDGTPGIAANYARKIGQTWWLRRNVAFEGKGKPFEDAPAMLDVFGSYLNWEDALSSCPQGYRLPSDKDWAELASALGAKEAAEHQPIDGIAPAMMADATFNFEEATLWSYWKGMSITDKGGLSILPAGYANLSSGNFSGVNSFAAFWTADEYDSERAYYRYINEHDPQLKVGLADKESFGASVRCVKED